MGFDEVGGFLDRRKLVAHGICIISQWVISRIAYLTLSCRQKEINKIWLHYWREESPTTNVFDEYGGARAVLCYVGEFLSGFEAV